MSQPLSEPAPSAPGPSLSDRVTKGAFWAAGSTLLLRFANIAIMAVVARIVAPAELGVFALTLVVYGVAVSVAELGVASAVARSDLDEREHAPTVATIAIISSLALGGLMAVFAEPLAVVLGSADAATPIRIMSLCVAMTGPFAVPGAQLQRAFRQDLVFRANAISFIPSSVVLVVIAMFGDGAVAFAWSRVVGQAVMGTLMFLSARPFHRPGLTPRLVPGLIRFGLPLAGSNLLGQVLLNVDYVFVAHFLSVTDVGYYNLAFNISVWSTGVIGSVLNGMVLPAFSRVRADGGDLPAAVQTAVRSVALVAFPITAVSLALAGPLIATIYGAKWSSAAPVLGVLALYGAISVICLLLSNIIVSTGRTVLMFIVQAVALAVLGPVMWGAIEVWGLIGAGIAHICVILLVTFPAYMVATRRSTGAGLGRVLAGMGPPAIAAAVAGAAGWGASLLVPGPILQLIAGSLVALIVYAVAAAPMLRRVLPPVLHRRRAVRRVLDAASWPIDVVTGHRLQDRGRHAAPGPGGPRDAEDARA